MCSTPGLRNRERRAHDRADASPDLLRDGRIGLTDLHLWAQKAEKPVSLNRGALQPGLESRLPGEEVDDLGGTFEPRTVLLLKLSNQLG